MNVGPHVADQDSNYQNSKPLHEKQRRWEAALLVCFAFLIAAGIFGIIVSILQSFGFSIEPRAALMGRCLLVVVYPVAFSAAHCLDKVRETKLAIRMNALQRSGLL